MIPPRSSRLLPPLVACFGLALDFPAAAQQLSQPLSFEQSEQLLKHRSGTLKAARLDVESKNQEAVAVQSLNAPQVNLTVAASRIERTYQFDLPPLLPNAPSIKVDATYQNTGVRPILSFNWPLYTGGKDDATHKLAQARAGESEADLQEKEEKLVTTLAQRYFGLQLARRALVVREQVAAGLTQHVHEATRYEQNGVITKADRLRAQVAFDEAQRNRLKSKSDVELAQIALNRLLVSSSNVQPSTPLFLHTQPIAPLDNFIEAGLRHHPGLATLESKRNQTEQLKALARAKMRPDVFAFGEAQLNRGVLTPVEPDWAIGVAIRFTLLDRVDRSSLMEAAVKQQQRVDALTDQAQSDIATLIEKNYRQLDQAREQYLLLQSSIESAHENLRLRDAGFREGLATSLDVVDARLALAKAETERAQAAYDYVTALAQLLEASGQSERFSEYAARADIRLEN